MKHQSIKPTLPFFLTLAIIGIFALCNTASAQDAVTTAQLKNESEVGIVVVAGNSKSQSYSLKQTSTYSFTENIFRGTAGFLRTSSDGVVSARSWNLGARYERVFSHILNGFLGQNIESNPFSGFNQRYNSDAGAKYKLYEKEAHDGLMWNFEAGYRFTRQNFMTGTQLNSSYLRIFTEIEKDWTKTTLTRFWIEGLPGLSDTSDYLINSELSVQAALTDMFSVKTAYLIAFDHAPAPGATRKLDSTFTTSLVARF